MGGLSSRAASQPTACVASVNNVSFLAPVFVPALQDVLSLLRQRRCSHVCAYIHVSYLFLIVYVFGAREVYEHFPPRRWPLITNPPTNHMISHLATLSTSSNVRLTLSE